MSNFAKMKWWIVIYIYIYICVTIICFLIKWIILPKWKGGLWCVCVCEIHVCCFISLWNIFNHWWQSRSAPWFLVHSPLIQVEGGILQVHSQGKSPFETHLIKMWTFMIAMFIHYSATLYYARSRITGSRCSKICD